MLLIGVVVVINMFKKNILGKNQQRMLQHYRQKPIPCTNLQLIICY